MSKVLVIGTIAKDAEVRVFGNGGKAATMFVEEKVKTWDKESQKMVDSTQVVELETINSKAKANADIVSKLPLGTTVVCEASLRVDTWKDARNGEMRSKQKVFIEEVTVVGASSGSPASPVTGYNPGERF